MKFFVDTADINDIRDLAATGLLDGVTTNPSLIAKAGKNFLSLIAEICEVVEGPVFGRHAKTGESFDRAARDETLGTARGAHAEEIDAVAHWAAAVASHFGFPIDLPCPLLAEPSA